MKRLKNILQSNIFIIFILIFTIFYSNYIIKNNKINSKYNLDSTSFEGYIKQVKIDDDKISLFIDDLIINYYSKEKNGLREYQVGDYVKINGKIKEPSSNTTPNLFNYKNYLYSKNIHYTILATNIEKEVKKIPFFYKIKRYLIEYINRLDNNEYFMTFILGDNSYLDNKITNSYNQNGISHLFALSGMHVTLLSSILLFLLTKIFNKNTSYFIIILFLIFYIFLTNFSKSIIRASVLFIILTLNKIFKLEINIIRIFIIFSCVVIILNPYNIYNVGFLFSYIISFYLILYSEIINREKNYLKKVFITSLIANFVSLPIMINNYFQINLLSPIINVLFVPLISLIIFPLSLICLMFPFFNFLFTISLNICENISLYLAKFNQFNLILSHINIYFIFLYYAVITFVLNKMKNKSYKSILLIIIFLLVHFNINKFEKKFLVTMIDVGQGDSILIKYPFDKGNILIDTGGVTNNKSDYSIVNNITIPYLKSLGIKKISYLVLTHGDYDHMGEAINLVNNFKVEKIIFNCGEFNDLEQELIKVLDKKKIPYYSCIKELNIDDNKLYFLNNREYGNENNNSSVIYTELDNHKFLFMGDAGVEVEKDLIDKYNLQNIDVLKVGHHGSKTSSSEEFIDEVNPKYSIISVGKNNRYGHPNKEVLDNLKESKIYRTDQDGSIMFKIKNNKLKIETCSS